MKVQWTRDKRLEKMREGHVGLNATRLSAVDFALRNEKLAKDWLRGRIRFCLKHIPWGVQCGSEETSQHSCRDPEGRGSALELQREGALVHEYMLNAGQISKWSRLDFLPGVVSESGKKRIKSDSSFGPDTTFAVTVCIWRRNSIRPRIHSGTYQPWDDEEIHSWRHWTVVAYLGEGFREVLGLKI